MTISDAVPIDPVLSQQYKRSQITFEQAPQEMIDACAPPLFAIAWILAEADRPEGRYVLLAGPIWNDDDDGKTASHKPAVEQFGDGGIVLLTQKGKCVGLWDPDNAFGNYFPENPANRPIVYDETLVQDMGLDLINGQNEHWAAGRIFCGLSMPPTSSLKSKTRS